MNREGIVIGGGASGLMAAIWAEAAGARVTILEHMPRVGKKILSTGNGKCNMTNLHLTAECYRCGEESFPMEVIGQFPVAETLKFFRSLGILTVDRNGYVYPASGQAQAVLEALKGRTESLGIRTVCEVNVRSARKQGKRFVVETDQGTFSADFLILATGSAAAKSTGSDGSGYALAKAFGHKIRKPLPALVQLRCEGAFFKAVAGVRTEATVSLFAESSGGKAQGRMASGSPAREIAGTDRRAQDGFLASDKGELQLTDYGISGIPVFQVSRYASEALDRKQAVTAVIDFFPSRDAEGVLAVLKEQRGFLADRPAEEFLNGIFNKKLAALFLKTAGIDRGRSVAEISDRKLLRLLEVVKEFSVPVTGTNSFEQAQVCMGGVSVREVDSRTMESKLVPGLYFAGEILDVDGICGGYNLQWAWSSGYLAGVSAAKSGHLAGISAAKEKRERQI